MRFDFFFGSVSSCSARLRSAWESVVIGVKILHLFNGSGNIKIWGNDVVSPSSQSDKVVGLLCLFTFI